MVKGDASPTGAFIWYIDEDGKGHNIPLQGTVDGKLKIVVENSDTPVDVRTNIQYDYTEENPSGDSIGCVNKPVEHTFHDEAITTADGTVFECDGQYKKARVSIIRTAVTTNQIDFLQSNNGVNYTPLIGVKVTADASSPALPVITTGINSTGTTTVSYEFDIEAVKYIMMDLSVLTGANATVTVEAVVV